MRSKTSAQVVRNAHHPQLVLGTFLNVRFCTMYCICICVYLYIYIYMYIDIYMPVMCIMNKPAFDTLMLQANLLWNTLPSDTPYSLSDAGIERFWLYFPTVQWPQCNITYTISWPSQCQAVWVGHVKNVMFGNIDCYVGSKTVALFSAVIAA